METSVGVVTISAEDTEKLAVKRQSLSRYRQLLAHHVPYGFEREAAIAGESMNLTLIEMARKRISGDGRACDRA